MLKRIILPVVVFLCVITLSTGSVSAQDKTGPSLGTTIDLKSWTTRDGRTLAEVIKGHSLAMTLLVSPDCGTCSDAKVGFRTLRERVGEPGIPYYVLLIPDGTDTQKFFAYADSLKIDTEVFVWSSRESLPPTSLVTMAVPSHLLVTNEGLLVNKWAGTTPK